MRVPGLVPGMSQMDPRMLAETGQEQQARTAALRRVLQQRQQQQQQRIERRQALEDNVPMSARDAQQVIREVKSEAPNKGRQRVTGVS